MNEALSWILDTVSSVDPLVRTLLAGVAMLLETSVLVGLFVPGDTMVIIAGTAVASPLEGVLLIIAFFIIIQWGVTVALRAQTRFARLTAAGIATTIFFYVAINMAMVMGLAPVVGVPLPLISFGGSSQMTIMLCIGILMSIDRQNRQTTRW